MLKFSTSRTLIATSIFALLAGCATGNPYNNPQGQQGQQGGASNKTAIYGGLGALGGAVVGAATSSKKDRGKGAWTSKKLNCAVACKVQALIYNVTVIT